MPRPAVAVLALAAVPLAAADPPVAPPAAVADLVAQLGSDDYPRREAASKKLDAVGPAALPALRAAARSANPEVARRAGDLAARIGRRAANERALDPTLVDLTADNAPLAAVLADLSKQAGFPVVVGGANAAEVADDRLTVRTGRVPFWRAVLAVCEAADLRIRSVSGYPAPGTTALADLGRAAAVPADGVVLEAAGVAAPRPAAVYGAVLVEGVRLPTADPPADEAVALLLVWPEPRLNWHAPASARVDRAATPAGGRLAVIPPDPLPAGRAEVVRRAGGRVVMVEANPSGPLPTVAGYTPNLRQAAVRLKPGPPPAPARADLTGAVFGVIRSEVEPLVRLAGLTPGAAAEGTHRVGVEMRAVVNRRAGGWEVSADLLYNPSEVRPAGGDSVARSEFVPRGGAAGRLALNGLRVADAAGRRYELTATAVSRDLRVDAARVSVRVTARLDPPDGGAGDPAEVGFWASYPQPVEVPFALKDVPLAGGTR